MWLHRSGGGICHWFRWRLCKSYVAIQGGTIDVIFQCVRAYVYESKVFVSMVLILIFGEVLGLYGCVAVFVGRV